MASLKLKVGTTISLIVLGMMAVFLSLQFDRTSTSAQDPQSNDSLLTAAASQNDLDAADLEIVALGEGDLPLTGVSIAAAKILDQSSGQIYAVALDAEGNAIDLDAANAAEQAAYREKYGTKTVQLAEKLEAAAPNQVLEVGFWLKSNHNNVARRADVPTSATGPAATAQVAASGVANQQRVSAAVASVNAPFVTDLEAAGYDVVYAATFSPAIFARVPASAVDALAGDPRVQTTYFTGDKVAETQNIVKTTTAATKVHNKQISGAGVTGGVVECCDSLFEENTADFDAENNAWLLNIFELRAAACGGDHSHPTAVSGIIQSANPVNTGIAPAATLVFNSSCTGAQAEVVAAMNSVSANVDGATNHSYGISTAGSAEPCPSSNGIGSLMERALDDLVRINADSQYVAAGNDGNTACVGSPAIAWNVVSVGSFDDLNTNGWAGDVMSGFSSGGDPASDGGSDRQEPDLAAPGSNFTGLLPSPGGIPTGNIGSGTSYATPVMVGGALLAEQRRAFLLGWPETEKAVLMAAACHNIEGAQTSGELDGAGGPDFLEMDTLLNSNRFRGDFIANGAGLAYFQNFGGVAVGQEIRVALAWDTNTAYALYGTDPSDDLDLVLKRPNGTIAATSSSFNNNNEVIEFVADAAGAWRIEVNRFRTSDPAGGTFAGLAWHKYPPANCTAP